MTIGPGIDLGSIPDAGAGGGGLNIPSDFGSHPDSVFVGSRSFPAGGDLPQQFLNRGFDYPEEQTYNHFYSGQKLLDQLDSKPDKYIRNLTLQLLVAGYGHDGTFDAASILKLAKAISLPDVKSMYTELLRNAADLKARGMNVSPEQLLQRGIEYRLIGQGVKWDGKLDSFDPKFFQDLMEKNGLSKAGTRTATSVSRDFMNPMDAKALVRGTLQQELGRDPTDAEFQDFLAAVHQAEASNPTRTTQTTTTDALGRLVSQNSTTQRGINGAGIGEQVLEKAQQQPNWAEWQAVGTYAPALYAALGSTVPGT